MKKSTLTTAAALYWGMNMVAKKALTKGYYERGTVNRISAGSRIDICANEINTISGVVFATGQKGHGLEINTGSEIVTIHGLGPQKFWNSTNGTLPSIGERVTLKTTTIIFRDLSTKTIAINMSINGQTIDLQENTSPPLQRISKPRQIQARSAMEEKSPRTSRFFIHSSHSENHLSS